MFIHIFIYRLKCILMDRELVFWTMLFPLVLATLFNMTIANLGNGQTFSPIDIAVVENEAWHKDDNFNWL